MYRVLNLVTMVDNDQVTSRLTLSPGELPLARPRRLSAPPSAGEDIVRERLDQVKRHVTAASCSDIVNISVQFTAIIKCHPNILSPGAGACSAPSSPAHRHSGQGRVEYFAQTLIYRKLLCLNYCRV